MKTNRLNRLLIAIALMPLTAKASDLYQCVHDLMPITQQAEFRAVRKNLADPFFVSSRFLVFPKTQKGSLMGFFVYDAGGAHFFNRATIPGQGQVRLNRLKVDAHKDVYDLVAQPEGLETITLHYVPGFHPNRRGAADASLLGGSVLPVVGALVTIQHSVPNDGYYDPMKANSEDVWSWLHRLDRVPASVQDHAELPHRILHLLEDSQLDKAALWAPLRKEYELRREWVQNHNLDKAAFRELSRAMQTSCAGIRPYHF